VNLVTSDTLPSDRVRADGKHLAVGERPFLVRGATYGSFLPRSDGAQFPEPAQLAADLDAMCAAGLNTVRTYTPPPFDLVEAAADRGLRLLVGLDYRDWRFEETPGPATRRRVLEAGRRALDEAMDRCAGRPEVLAISVGNEVPPDVARVHGIGAIADTLGELVAAVHLADPAALATYANFPSTEYLEIEGLDLACFNVFLESGDDFDRYVRHLMCVTGARPLLITELGLAAEVHGATAQAATLDRQLRTVDEAGCAGATVFSWTDDWGVDGHRVQGWGFGITDAARRPKPALDVVSSWAGRSTAELRNDWPTMSVVVCAYNERRTIESCLASLAECDYPDLDVIVCDDGSTDGTLEIARRSPHRVLALPHGGLSAARNAGIAAARGEIVAFIDADAACHPSWPWHLALSLDDPHLVATGGPNLPFPDAPFVERAVARSPGAPTEVLIADDRAEHVPGCNMAFRRDALVAVGSFDARYTSAGDDVDVCWKLLDHGGQIGFAPAAQVRHHRRGSVRGYLRQQRGYGRAEKLLSGAHRHRFNRLGQARWTGFIYGGARLLPSLLRPVVYHGSQGHAPFQSVLSHRAEIAANWASAVLPLLVPIAVAGALAALLNPWWLVVPGAVLSGVLGYALAVGMAARLEPDEDQRLRLRALIGFLHVAQPLARTWGRVRSSRLRFSDATPPEWRGDRAEWLGHLERVLRCRGLVVRVPDLHAPWDIQVVYGPFVRARITTAVVWGWQPQWRVTVRPRLSVLLLVATTAALATISLPAAVVIGVLSIGVLMGCALRVHRLVRAALSETTTTAAARVTGEPRTARPGGLELDWVAVDDGTASAGVARRTTLT
jgi:glycosyltransferase involved in cell wall biosynthesis